MDFLFKKNPFFAVVYKRFLAPNGLDTNDTLLNGAFVDLLLASVGIDQPYIFSDMITKKYFRPGQMGDLSLMAPGAVDVSNHYTYCKS